MLKPISMGFLNGFTALIVLMASAYFLQDQAILIFLVFLIASGFIYRVKTGHTYVLLGGTQNKYIFRYAVGMATPIVIALLTNSEILKDLQASTEYWVLVLLFIIPLSLFSQAIFCLGIMVFGGWLAKILIPSITNDTEKTSPLDSQLYPVSSYQSLSEAYIAKEQLEEHGVPVFIQNETQLLPNAEFILNIPPSHAEKAEAILNNYQQGTTP